jgi:hypothetical protein
MHAHIPGVALRDLQLSTLGALQWLFRMTANEFGKGMPANDEPEKGTERAEH